MESHNVIKALRALAQESRLAIFRLLVEHGYAGLPAGGIADRLGLPPATLSFHLKELTRAGLITAHPEGRFIYYRTDFVAMHALIGYLTENCCSADGCDPASLQPFPAKQALASAAGLLGKPTIRAKWRFA
jgi:ArsR family transcriptional regulator, arsenate/arsenite/antimonite-responsive transcriptional repressor